MARLTAQTQKAAWTKVRHPGCSLAVLENGGCRACQVTVASAILISLASLASSRSRVVRCKSGRHTSSWDTFSRANN